MQTLKLNENVLGWDCDKLEVIYNGKSTGFDTLWELLEYLEQTYGVMLTSEEGLTEELFH